MRFAPIGNEKSAQGKPGALGLLSKQSKSYISGIPDKLPCHIRIYQGPPVLLLPKALVLG